MAILKSFRNVAVFFCVACLPLAAQESLPQSSNATVAANETSIPSLIKGADQAIRNRDYSTCAQLLEQVVATDPNYKNAWNYLGWTYNALGQYAKAEEALRKAIVVNPNDPQAYNNLGQALAFQKRYNEAIPQYQKQAFIRPRDPWAHANLGRMYLLTKEYKQAIEELEVARGITPDEANIPFNMGRAYAKLNQPALAAEMYAKSVELQPVPIRWNAVAYQMAEDRIDLAQAEKYATAAIAATFQQMRDTSLEHVTREDVYKTWRIASYWDTWGWIRFQEGALQEAEKYVKSAWQVHALSIDSDHLAQILEKLGRKPDAIRMYQMAVATEGATAETRERLIRLAGEDANIDAMIEEGKGLLKESRTIRVQNSHAAEGFAEFWVLMSPGATVRGVKFVTGDEELKPFEKDLAAAPYPDPFPEATEMRMLRRGRLTCTHDSPDCRLFMLSSVGAPAEEIPAAAPSVAGDIGRVMLTGNAVSAKLLKKVQPIYPPEARQARIQGVVRLHTIIGKDGRVSKLDVVSGHPYLLQAALDAVRQWQYEPMLVDGKPVEVDTVIDVYFQLINKP